MREVVVRMIVQDDNDENLPFLDAFAAAWDMNIAGPDETYEVVSDSAGDERQEP